MVDAQVPVTVGPTHQYFVDVALRASPGGPPLVVFDTQYKDHAVPSPGDIQQVVFYATVLGCRQAVLVYPRPVTELRFDAGNVTVRTVGVDLNRIPPADALRDALGAITGSSTRFQAHPSPAAEH